MPGLTDIEDAMDAAIEKFLEDGGTRDDVMAALELKLAAMKEEAGD